MNISIKALLVGIGLAISSHTFAAYGTFENMKATCYIFKNNQLSQKHACTYGGMSGVDIEDKTSTNIH